MISQITERDIVFTGDLVLAVMQNRKWQTRRGRGLKQINQNPDNFAIEEFDGAVAKFKKLDSQEIIQVKCPYAVDRLWVRETFCIADNSYGSETSYFKADNPCPKDVFHPDNIRWKSPYHMSKGQCRLRLDVKNRRIERLHDITQSDAIAEGIEEFSNMHGYSYYRDYVNGGGGLKPIESFRSLWQSLHGKDAWNENIWLWVVEFAKCQ